MLTVGDYVVDVFYASSDEENEDFGDDDSERAYLHAMGEDQPPMTTP